MNTESKQELYTFPDMEVIDVKARQVMCASTNSMTVDDTFYF